jgi:hypothetical protein
MLAVVWQGNVQPQSRKININNRKSQSSSNFKSHSKMGIAYFLRPLL